MINLSCANWHLANVEAIIFDKDGTIVGQDLYWGEVVTRRVAAVLEFYNLDKSLSDELTLSLGFDKNTQKLTQNAPIATLSREDVIIFLMKQLPIETKFEDLDELFAKVHETINPRDFIEPISACIDLIKQLKQLPVTLVLITSDGYKNTLKTLDTLDLLDDFELILGKENCDQPKETGLIVTEALELIGISPQNTIAIGDTKCDFDMAKNANLKACILVPTGQVPIEELRTYSQYCTISLDTIVTNP